MTPTVMQREISTALYNTGDGNRTGSRIFKKISNTDEDSKHPQMLTHYLPRAGFFPKLPLHFITVAQTQAHIRAGSDVQGCTVREQVIAVIYLPWN